jgi:hypothetical protein
MMAIARSRPDTCASAWRTLCVLIIGGSVLVAAAQEKSEDKGETYSGKMVKVEGQVRCQKADPVYAIEVPDRPGHALTLARRKCTWTEPWTVAEAKPKDGVSVIFAEQMEGALHMHGYETDNVDTGDQITFRIMGQMPAGNAPSEGKGRWSFMRGTGKFKGIEGGGTYEAKQESDGTLTLKLEGVYVPSAMAAGQK